MQLPLSLDGASLGNLSEGTSRAGRYEGARFAIQTSLKPRY